MRLWRSILLIVIIFSMSGCVDKEAEAEKVAQGFAITWQSNDWNSLYDYFTNDSRSMRSRSDFFKFVNASSPRDFILIYDKVVLQEGKEAYAYYTFSGEYLFQPRAPAMRMVYEDDGWKIDEFEYFFNNSCVVSSCNDSDICTAESCNSETGFMCEYSQNESCCYLDMDCGEDTPFCQNNTCVAEECYDFVDCLGGICSNNRCVECENHNDCASNVASFCDEGKCVGCVTDVNCRNLYDNEKYCDDTLRRCVECRNEKDCDSKYPYCVSGVCYSYDASKYESIALFLDGGEKIVNLGGVPYKVSLLRGDSILGKIKVKIGDISKWISPGNETTFFMDEDTGIIVHVLDASVFEDEGVVATLVFAHTSSPSSKLAVCGNGLCEEDEFSLSLYDPNPVCNQDCLVLRDSIYSGDEKTYSFFSEDIRIRINSPDFTNFTINKDSVLLDYRKPVNIMKNIFIQRDSIVKNYADEYSVRFLIYNRDN